MDFDAELRMGGTPSFIDPSMTIGQPQSSADGLTSQDPTQDQPESDQDQDDEEDEEEEDEDEEEQRIRPKKKRRKMGGNRFIDIEAEVDEDDEEEEEDDDAGAGEGFLVDEVPAEGDLDTDRYHRTLDLSRQSLVDKDAAQIAREIEARDRLRLEHARNIDQMGSGELPQHALMPDVNDPTIWAIKVRPNKERDIIMGISGKAMAQKLNIISAFYRESLKGYIYVEATEESAVMDAVHGLIGVYVSSAPLLIPLEERTSLLTTKRKEAKLLPGNWVRFRRGKYAGDIAQILEVPNTGSLTLKYIPRIDLNPSDDAEVKDENGRKRKKTAHSTQRPPPRLFDFDDVKLVYGQKAIAYKMGAYEFQNEEFKDGFCIKDHRLNTLILEDVKPTIDEITKFSQTKEARRHVDDDDDDNEDGRRKRSDGPDGGLDLRLIAEATSQAAKSTLRPGDSIEIFKGAQKGLLGTIESVSDNILSISPDKDLGLGDELIDVDADFVRKRFKIGDNVRVLAGVQTGERGLVVNIDGAEVSLMSSLTGQEVKVFSRDLREAAESELTEATSAKNSTATYDLHDLVQVDPQNAGVIFDIDGEMFHVLDQTRMVRKLKADQILGKVPSRMQQVATDQEGNAFHQGDTMKESVTTAVTPREGKVLHSYRATHTWLFNRNYQEHKGVFVIYSQLLKSDSIRTKKALNDSTKMNPSTLMPPPPVPLATASTLGRIAPRDKLIGQRVMISGRSLHKGKEGKVKDVNGAVYRVELSSTNKVVNVAKAQLFVFSPGAVQPEPAEQWLERQSGGSRRTGDRDARDGSRAPSEFGSNGATYASNTPSEPYTPGHNPYKNATTPNPYKAGRGGKTPNVWAAGGSTTYGSNTTYGNSTAWGGSTPQTARTPLHQDAWNVGSKTPAPPRTTDQWGSRTPLPASGGYYPPPTSDHPSTRPTPGSAPTPYNSAVTPANEPTPAAGKSYINPDRLALRNDSDSHYPTAPTPASSHSRGGRRAIDQTGANTQALAYNRWGSGNAADAPTPAPLNVPTPAAISAPTPGAQPMDAATPGRGVYERPYNGPTPGVYHSHTPAEFHTPAAFNQPTPGVFNHQTPGVYGTPGYLDIQTPGASFARPQPNLDASLPAPGWPDVGLNVLVGPNERGQSHLNARNDGQTGYIIEPRGGVCLVRLQNEQDFNIPIGFLRPVPPTAQNTPCVVIGHGPHRGERVKTLYQDAGDWMCEGIAEPIDGRDLCVYDPSLV